MLREVIGGRPGLGARGARRTCCAGLCRTVPRARLAVLRVFVLARAEPCCDPARRKAEPCAACAALARNCPWIRGPDAPAAVLSRPEAARSTQLTRSTQHGARHRTPATPGNSTARHARLGSCTHARTHARMHARRARRAPCVTTFHRVSPPVNYRRSAAAAAAVAAARWAGSQPEAGRGGGCVGSIGCRAPCAVRR